jgi:formylglycine-generating enzyme required for sulfatase activity
MGTFDVTAAQYTQFLDAVAKADPYKLYNSIMASGWAACHIRRTGSSGSYVYTVDAGYENRPVNMVSWASAARFCNWLTNNQPTGAQGSATTESGSYFLNGATTDQVLVTITRSANARYVLPTINEWHKAAYYDPEKPGGAGYWDYSTMSDSLPSNMLSGSGNNNANYYNGGYTDPVHYLTDVGAFTASPSAYGTFDQGGNVWQWTENVVGNIYHDLRGGSFADYGSYMRADYLCGPTPPNVYSYIGFRVSEVPEPGTLAILAIGAVGLLKRRKIVRG